MLKTDRDVPLYQQLRAQLITQIEAGMYQPHDPLPSERQLSVDHGVSRPTVRKALQALHHEGRLYIQHGKGSFVAPRETDGALDPCLGAIAGLDDAPLYAHSRLLRAGRCQAAEPIAHALGIAPQRNLICVHRLLSHGKQPLGLHSSYIPAELGARLLLADLTTTPQTDSLASICKLQIVQHTRHINARTATAVEQARLGLTGPLPVLEVRCWSYRSEQRLTFYSELVYRGDWSVFIHGVTMSHWLIHEGENSGDWCCVQ